MTDIHPTTEPREDGRRRSVPSPRKTGGIGFSYEDQVIGYFLLHLLRKISPLRGIAAPLTKVSAQQSREWPGFDDLVLSFEDGTRCAISTKSTPPVTARSASAELVRAAWGLHLHQTSSIFDGSRDWLGLACPPRDTLAQLQKLLPYAEFQSGARLSANVHAPGYAGEESRAVFDSFQCPEDLANGLGKEEASAGRILMRMRVIGLDMDTRDSVARNGCLASAQDLTAKGNHSAAVELWNALCRQAELYRTSGGDCDRNSLVEAIAGAVELRELPDFRSDWQRIQAASRETAGSVKRHIGSGIRINRDAESRSVRQAMAEHSCVALLGASGCGKTAIAASIAEEASLSGKRLLWIRGSKVGSGYLDDQVARLQLNHTFSEIIRAGSSLQGTLVIDEAEKVQTRDGFSEIARVLTYLGSGPHGQAWDVIFVCRSEEWDRILRGITHSMDSQPEWHVLAIDAPTGEVLSPVWEAYPNLRSLAAKPHLSTLFRNLKFLDVVVAAHLTGRDLPQDERIGEAQIVNWCWDALVLSTDRGTEKSAFLQRLAAELADAGSTSIPETEIDPAEVPLIRELSVFLRYDRQAGLVSFLHDLPGDWARFRVLRSKGTGIASFVELRHSNPHWAGAIRLVGVEALQSDDSGGCWRSLLERIPKTRNLMLEALIFAHDPFRCLTCAWTSLARDDGLLLRHLLRRFQHAATVPNPRYMELAESVGMSAIEAQSWERLPLWPYWIPLLRFLASRREDAVTLAHDEVSRIAKTWLYYAPSNWPGRQQAADLAVEAVWRLHKTRPHEHHKEKGSQSTCYQAALLGYRDCPEEVGQLVRKAAGRVPPVPDDGKAFEVYQPPGTLQEDPLLGKSIRVPEPWPDGPCIRVHGPFAEACLMTGALVPMIEESPTLAQEVILACLIKAPNPWDDLHGSGLHAFEEAGLSDRSLFYPGFYTQGPFLRFLHMQPSVALDTTLRLVDFATERHIHALRRGEFAHEVLDVRLPGIARSFVGDAHIYHWYTGKWGTDPVASALMAVEKWLYDLIEADEDVEPWIDQLLGSSYSLAILGLLAEVGRYKPILFFGVLKPLLLCFEVYELEDVAKRQGLDQFGVQSGLGESEQLFNLKRDWSGMPHRRFRIHEIAARLLHSSDKLKTELSEAALAWKSDTQPEGTSRHDLAAYLGAFFDPSNWASCTVGGAEAMQFTPPDEIVPSDEDMQTFELGQLTYAVPIRCRQLLDAGDGITDELAQELLDHAVSLSTWEDGSQSTIPFPRHPADALCGIAAVLVRLAPAWLTKEPERKKWCVEVLLRTLATPPPWGEFDIPESIGSYDWEHFACEVLPVLWSEEPESLTYRRAVGRLVFAKHYNAASRLTRACFEVRASLGPEYWRIVDLMIKWAFIRWDLGRASDPSERTQILESADATLRAFSEGEQGGPIRNWLSKFVRKKAVMPTLENWAQMALDHGERRHLGHRSGPHSKKAFVIHPAADLQQLRAAFEGSFALDEADNRAERARFVSLWRDALDVSLASTRPLDDSGQPLDLETAGAEMPFDFENWTLEQVASIVAQMKPEEQPSQLWEPILGLGVHADLRVRRFLGRWHIEARRSCPKGRFADYWRQMVEFALSAPAWQCTGRNAYEGPGLWLELLGLLRFSKPIWTDADRATIRECEQLFRQALPFVLRGSHETARFLDWLGSGSAQDLRLRLFDQIADSSVSADDAWLQSHKLDDELARFLCCLWANHQIELMANTAGMERYRSLLARIADLQNSIALELQHTISSIPG